jgi:hypothetical protein
MSFSVCSFTLPEGERCSDESPTLRHFTRFSQAARENALSRIYMGFHFRDGCEDRDPARREDRQLDRETRHAPRGLAGSRAAWMRAPLASYGCGGG